MYNDFYNRSEILKQNKMQENIGKNFWQTSRYLTCIHHYLIGHVLK